MSLILSHILLALHNYATDTSASDTSKEHKEALWNHAFSSSRRCVATCKRYAVVLLLLATIALICCGATLNSFAFHFRGAAGFLLNVAGQDASASYSLVSLGLALPSAAAPSCAMLVRIVQVAFFLFTLGIPLAHLVAVLILWVVPMKHTTQRRVFVGKINIRFCEPKAIENSFGTEGIFDCFGFTKTDVDIS